MHIHIGEMLQESVVVSVTCKRLRSIMCNYTQN